MTALNQISKRLHRITFDLPSIMVRYAPLLVIDSTGTVQVATNAIERLFGYIEGALVGMHVNDLIPVRFREEHTGHLERYFSNPIPREMGATTMDLIALHKNGSEFRVEITLNPFVADGPDERTTYVAATIVKIRGQ